MVNTFQFNQRRDQRYPLCHTLKSRPLFLQEPPKARLLFKKNSCGTLDTYLKQMFKRRLSERIYHLALPVTSPYTAVKRNQRRLTHRVKIILFEEKLL